MSKRALGRGIDALLKLEETQPNAASVQQVELALLVPGEHQPRKTFGPEALQELADSIRHRGVLQPILVEKTPEDRYRIVAGERRARAAELAGLNRVPVLVSSFTEQERLEIALIENVQREDLSPLEEAAAYQQLMSMADINQEELARRVGKKRSTVSNAVRLLKLPPPMQESLRRGELTAGHARAILSLINPADQEILHRRILQESLSVRGAEALAARMSRGDRSERKRSRTQAPGLREPELQEIEQRLLERMGTRVTIKGTTRRGRIEIDYFSSEDLERIYAQLDRA
jgi:ParB family chromosome partitioning protein